MYKDHIFSKDDLKNIVFREADHQSDHQFDPWAGHQLDHQSNQHISSLSFSCKGAKFLENAKEWKNIPPFCVLTGSNGSGKSHLLEYIHNLLQEKEKEKGFMNRHIYFKSNHDNETWDALRFDENTEKLVINSQTYYKELAQYSPFFPENFKDSISNKNSEKEFDGVLGQVQQLLQKDELPKRYSDQSLKYIKDILEKYNFNFALEESKDSLEPYIGLKRKDIEGSPLVKPEKLSFGEREILYIITKYSFYSYEQELAENEIGILLLDEPDRHLDPKTIATFLKILKEQFVDLGVQVIMTTHRLDTIALAPEKSIFFLQKNQETQISEIIAVSQKQALYSMTRNLRDMTSIQIKVYTESASDSDFYCGVYHSLFNVSNQQRDFGKKRLEFKDQKSKEHTYTLLSRRYPLLFVPASSDKKGKEGGWKQVKISVIRDQTILEKKKVEKKRKTKVISDTRAYNSLGIVDNDNNQHNSDFEEEELDERIVIPKERYSLENFLLDPIILCSIWEPKDAASFLHSFVPKGQLLPEGGQEKFNQEKKEKFIQICTGIKAELEKIETLEEEKTDSNKNSPIDIQNLQSELNKYFTFLDPIYKIFAEPEKQDKKDKFLETIQDIRKKFFETFDKIKGNMDGQKGLNLNIEDLLNEYSTSLQGFEDSHRKAQEENARKSQGNLPKKPKLPGGFSDVKFLVLNGINKIVSVQYPTNFLKIRGHDLAQLGFNPSKEKSAEFVAQGASNIYINGLAFIPEELVDVIFKLNGFAKEQNNDKQKKTKKEKKEKKEKKGKKGKKSV